MMRDFEITRTSPFTGFTRTKIFRLDPVKYREWMEGKIAIQYAFPHLSADDREFIKTGITAEEWKTMLPPEE